MQFVLFFLARLYWTLPRIGHLLHLLFNGSLATFQTLTSGGHLFLIHSTRPTKRQLTNYSINSSVTQHFLQGTIIHAVIIWQRLTQKRLTRPVTLLVKFVVSAGTLSPRLRTTLRTISGLHLVPSSWIVVCHITCNSYKVLDMFILTPKSCV